MSRLQKRFKKETGLPAKFKQQRYGGDQNGPEIWNDEYVKWVENKVSDLENQLSYVREEQFERRSRARGEQGIYG